jgi:hypothetical protein
MVKKALHEMVAMKTNHDNDPPKCATPATAPVALTNSNCGHVHWHAGTVSRPVITPRARGTYSASNLPGFRSSVISSMGNYI